MEEMRIIVLRNIKHQPPHQVLLHGRFLQSHAMNRMIASTMLSLDLLAEHMDTDPLQVAHSYHYPFTFCIPFFLSPSGAYYLTTHKVSATYFVVNKISLSISINNRCRRGRGHPKKKISFYFHPHFSHIFILMRVENERQEPFILFLE